MLQDQFVKRVQIESEAEKKMSMEVTGEFLSETYMKDELGMSKPLAFRFKLWGTGRIGRAEERRGGKGNRGSRSNNKSLQKTRASLEVEAVESEGANR